MADGLHRDLGREIRRATELEQRVLLAQGAVLAHVPAGLTHEPDGRSVDGLKTAGAKESGIGRSVGHLEQGMVEFQFGAEPEHCTRAAV